MCINYTLGHYVIYVHIWYDILIFSIYSWYNPFIIIAYSQFPRYNLDYNPDHWNSISILAVRFIIDTLVLKAPVWFYDSH